MNSTDVERGGIFMAFKAIESQEEFDLAVKDRLERQAKKYEGYMSPDKVQELKNGYEEKLKNQPSYEGYTSPDDLNQIKKDYDQTINNLTSENAKLKKTALKQDIAYEYKIPRDMASRLRGETEEELRKDADVMATYISQSTTVAPLADPSINSDGGKSDIHNLISQLHK